MLNELVPDFTKELAGFCNEHCGNRNAELHTGEERFAGLNRSQWLHPYYATCEVLLKSMGKNLSDLFSDSRIAEEMISAFKDTAAKAVAREIELSKKGWNDKSPEDQKQSLARTALWSTRQAGHRVKCPACESPALVKGTGWGAVSTEIDHESGLIVQKQKMLPSAFECIACGLKIAGLSRLSACGLGDPFIDATTSSAADYFDLHTEEELDEARALTAPEFEEDFNEQFEERDFE